MCVIANTMAPFGNIQHSFVLNENEFILNPIRQEMICIYRREVIERFSLPEDLRGCESLFLYNISRAYKFLVVAEPGRIIHRQGDNLSDANSIISRSRDIAIMWERILSNHEDILRSQPEKIVEYLINAMYRYGIVGDRTSCVKTYRRILRQRPTPIALLKATGVFVLSLLGPTWFEKWRINRLNRRLGFKVFPHK